MVKERTHPDCVNASNPYHTCVEFCYRRIAQIKTAKGRKDSGNRGGIEESEFPKRMAQQRRVNPDCSNASNPYHVCADYCFERIGNGKAQMNKKASDTIFIDAPQRSSKKKKKGAKSQPKQSEMTDNVSVLIKVHSPEVLSPSSFSSSHKTVGSGNGEPISSSQQRSEETRAQDPSFNGGQIQSLQLVPTSGNITMTDGPQETSITAPSEEGVTCITSPKPTKQEDDLGESITRLTSPHVGSMSSNISDVTVAFEDGDEEDIQSVISNSKVLVGKYYVKASYSSILESIFDKYGDIAESCLLESALIRSYYLECICFVVQELQSISLMQLTKSKIKELYAILSDVESSQINISWLRQRLDEIAEALELISHHRTIKEAKAKCDQSLEATRKELELQMEDLAQKEKEVADGKARVLEMKNHLSELELESSQLSDSFSTIRSKVENMQLKPVSD